MKLNFKSNDSVQAAKRLILKSNIGDNNENIHSLSEAFMILIRGVGKENLDNLCNELKIYYPELSEEECYNLTQGEGKIFENNPNMAANVIFKCANSCLSQGMHLGNNEIAGGKINTSSWISHSIYEAQIAGDLAQMLGVNKEKAMTLAILHDFGRKDTHTFEHVTEGFDNLVKIGWENEAVATLTHSFINGGRCANCDPAEEGFYIDDEGQPKWEYEEAKDDVAKFLESYTYNIYDDILNISDLMATDRGIVSPAERIDDIATRKTPDSKNRNYFLSEFINKMSEMLVKIGKIDEFQPIDARLEDTKIKELFEDTSKIFFESYKESKKIFDQAKQEIAQIDEIIETTDGENSERIGLEYEIVSGINIAELDKDSKIRESELAPIQKKGFREWIKGLVDKMLGKGEK